MAENHVAAKQASSFENRLNRQSPSRREFLRSSGAVVVGGALAANLLVARGAHAAGSDVLKLGLIGCGGRGSGAVGNAFAADPHLKLTALADTFADRLQGSLERIRKESPDRVAVDADHQFVGFDAY